MESGKVNVKARTCQWLFGWGIIHQNLFHILTVSCLTPVHKMAGNNAILRDHFLNFNLLLCSDHGWHSNQLKWRGLLKGIEAQHGSRTTVWSSKIWKILPLICSYTERNFISNWLWIRNIGGFRSTSYIHAFKKLPCGNSILNEKGQDKT